jgi:predicted transcriptional regulator
MTTSVVAAYVAGNRVEARDLPVLIRNVYATLQELASGRAKPQDPLQEPAVTIKKSVTPDYIICLEDGKKFKSLKRHLRTRYSMTPDEYRAKWNLPHDYPMVAPNYARERSNLAKKMGLGHARKNEE